VANVTFTVDEQTLRRARILALERGTSVNAMVRDFLERTVAEAGEGTSRADRLAALVAAGRITGGQPGEAWPGRAALYASEPRYALGAPAPHRHAVHEPQATYRAKGRPKGAQFKS
jgi:hypothetical protein